MKKGFKFQSDIDRFISYVDPQPTLRGCYLWLGSKNPAGYGRFTIAHQRWEYAHRWIYSYYYDSIPKGMVIMHSCDTSSCVNPLHLSIGSHADNVKDKISKGRQLKGEKASWSKLTEENVRDIRKRYKKQTSSSRELAAEYNLNSRTIRRIIHNDIWQHVN